MNRSRISLTNNPWVNRLAMFAAASTALAFSALPIAGCGGGSDSASAPSRTGSTLALTIHWPPPVSGRLVPAASNSIMAVLTGSAGSQVGQQLITRPMASPWTSSVTFTGITTPQVTLTATAFPNSDGTGTAQATGSAPATINPGQKTSVTVTMVSTIDHLTITPMNPTVYDNESLPLTVTAYDANGNIVLMTPNKINWQTANAGYATVDGSGNVTGTGQGPVVITATDAESGKSASDTVTAALPPGPVIGPRQSVASANGKFLYVTRAITRDLKVFSIGSGGGLSVSSVPTIELGQYPIAMWIATNANGSYLYLIAADNGPLGSNNPNAHATIYQYSVNADGSLTALSPATVPALSAPVGITGDATGKYVFDIDENALVRCFTIGANGALVVNGADFNNDEGLEYVGPAAVHGGVLYVGSPYGVDVFTILPATGTLALNSNYLTIGFMFGMSFAPSGSFAYLSVATGIKPYSVNSNGSLTQDGSGVATSAANEATAVSPDGLHLYSIGESGKNNVVSQYSVNGDGTLLALSPATVPAGLNTTSITISKDGKYLYVTDYNSDSISQYSIGANGILTALSPASVGS